MSSVPCGTVITNLNFTANAANVTGATQYRFNFYDNVTNALIATKTQASRTFTFSSVVGLYYGNTYKWTVAVDKGTGFGPESNNSCTIIFAQPVTTVPCGVSYSNLSAYTASPFVPGARNYRYSFYNNTTNALVSVKTQTTNYLYFNTVSGINYGNTYKYTVDVEYYNGTAYVFGPASSNACTITFNAPQTTVPCGMTYAYAAYSAVPAVAGANGFRYNFYDATSNALVATTTNTNQYIYFYQVPGIIFNKTYKWTVAVRYSNGTANVFGPESAMTCTMNYGTPSSFVTDGSITDENNTARLSDNSFVADNDTWLNVYPNPNNGAFNVATNKDMTVNIVNEYGQIVRTFTLNEENGHELFVKELSNGFYFIIGQNESQTLKQKIIVNQ